MTIKRSHKVPLEFYNSIIDSGPIGYWTLSDGIDFYDGPYRPYDYALIGVTPNFDLEDPSSEEGTWQNWFYASNRWSFDEDLKAYAAPVLDLWDAVTLRNQDPTNPYTYAEAVIWFSPGVNPNALAGLKFNHEGTTAVNHFTENNNGYGVYITPSGLVKVVTSSQQEVHNFSGDTEKGLPTSKTGARKLGIHRQNNTVVIYLDDKFVGKVTYSPSTEDDFFALGVVRNGGLGGGSAYFSEIKVGWLNDGATPAHDGSHVGFYAEDVATPSIRQEGPFGTLGLLLDGTLDTPFYASATPYNFSSDESFTIGCVVELRNPNLDHIQSIVNKLSGTIGQYSIEYDNRSSEGNPERLRFTHGVLQDATPQYVDWEDAATPLIYGGLLHCVYDADTSTPTTDMKIYWNGELMAVATNITSNATPNDQLLTAGGWDEITGFAGLLSNLAIYDYALSEDQISHQASSLFRGGVIL